LNSVVSVIAALSFAVVANFSLLASRFFKSCVLLLSNFVENSVICHPVNQAADASLRTIIKHSQRKEIQSFFIRK
jgi:hypothetical protein